MTKLMHSFPWTLALSLAAQAGESQAIRIPTARMTQECCLDENRIQDESLDRTLYDRIKKSLEM
jgi:hypothetical protein